jgi:hypothetical protein
MTRPSLKILKNGGSLSEYDLGLLTGTPILINMMRNRIMVILENDIDISWENLTSNVEHLYYIRKLSDRKTNGVYQVWFESQEDLETFEKNSMLNKLGATVVHQ